VKRRGSQERNGKHPLQADGVECLVGFWF